MRGQLAQVYPGKAEQIEKDPRRIHLESQFSYLFSELRRVGVTRQLLWQEYINEYPDGFGYSRFCELLQEHIRKQGATMRFEHDPGKLLRVDYTGDMLHYVDTDSGELIACPVLVAVLPFSGYSYVEYSQVIWYLTGTVIHHIKSSKPVSAGQAIAHKVHAPFLINTDLLF